MNRKLDCVCAHPRGKAETVASGQHMPGRLGHAPHPLVGGYVHSKRSVVPEVHTKQMPPTLVGLALRGGGSLLGSVSLAKRPGHVQMVAFQAE